MELKRGVAGDGTWQLLGGIQNSREACVGAEQGPCERVGAWGRRKLAMQKQQRRTGRKAWASACCMCMARELLVRAPDRESQAGACVGVVVWCAGCI